MRVGAIAASALIAKATTAVAEENREWWRFMDWGRDKDRDRDRDPDHDPNPSPMFFKRDDDPDRERRQKDRRVSGG